MNCSAIPATITSSDNLVDLPLNANIHITFSAPLSRASVIAANLEIADVFAGYSAPLHPTLDVTGRQLTLIGTPLLPANLGNGVLGGPLLDTCRDRVPLPNMVSTGNSVETARPQLLATSILNGSTGIPTSPNLAFRFDQPVSSNSVAANVALSSAAGPVPLTLGQTSDATRVVLTPTAPLAVGATYKVTYGAGIANAAGTPLTNPGSFSFTTTTNQPGSPDEFAELYPQSWNIWSQLPVGTDVEPKLVSSVALDATTVDAKSLVLTDQITGAVIPAVVSLSNGGLNLILKPDSPLLPNRPYHMEASASLSTVTGLAYFFPSGGVDSFTTGSGPGLLAKVVFISPPDGATGVALNPTIAAQFNTNVYAYGPSTPSALLTASDGTTIAGSVTVNGTGASWNLQGQLKANTTYTVRISGLFDLAGNPVSQFESKFTTGPPSESLQLLNVSPASGATDVAQNAPIVLTFNMDVDTISLNNPEVSAGFGPVPGTWTTNGNTATFTPTFPYPSATAISVFGTVSSYTSYQNVQVHSTFVTQNASSIPAFHVVAISPANNSTGILPIAPISIQFSEPVLNPAFQRIQILSGNTPLYASPFWSLDARTLTFPGGWPANATLTIVLGSQITDIYGTPLQPFVAQYETALPPSPSSLAVLQTRPVNSAIQVDPSSAVYLYLNRAGIDEASAQSGLSVSVNGVIIQTQMLFPDPQTIELVPSEPLPQGAHVVVAGTAQDSYGNTLSFNSLSFTTTDASNIAAPEPVRWNIIWPAGSANPTFEVEYDQPLLASSVTTQAVSLSYQSRGVNVTVRVQLALASNNRVLNVTLKQAVEAGANYFLSINSQTDAPTINGANGIAAVQFNESFPLPSTATSAPAHVIGTIPDNSFSGVGTNAALTVFFDHGIDFISVSPATVFLTAGTTSMPLTVALDSSGTVLSLTPQQPLAANTAYTLHYTGLTDYSGNSIAAGSISFITGAGPDLQPPQVLASSFGASAIATNAPITLVFDHAIALATLESWVPVPGSWTESADRKTATFTPSEPWPAQSTVSFSLGAVQDESGVGNPNGFSFYFPTGLGSGAAAPQITGTYPQSGATGLPRNVSIQVAFREAISPAALASVTLSNAAGPVPIAASVMGNGTILSVVPSSPLASFTTYALTVSGITSTSGVPLINTYSLRFTTASGMLGLPMIVAENPVGQAQNFSYHAWIRLFYNQPINPLWLSNSNFVVTNTATLQPVTGSVVLSADGRVISFAPTEAWTPGATYRVSMQSEFYDIAGNALGVPNWTFTTPDTLGSGTESIATISPPNQATNVPQNAVVQIAFTTPVDPGTANLGTLWITDPSGNRVPGAITVPSSYGGTTPNTGMVAFTLNPATTWAPNTTYTIHVSGVTNESGLPAPSFTSTFQTSATVAVPGNLAIVKATPPIGSTLPGSFTPITFEFNEPVDPLSCSSLPVTVNTPSTLGDGNLPGIWTVSGNVATFTPQVPYPPDALIYLGENITDLAGNGITVLAQRPFYITGAATQPNPFRVLAITPANGATGLGPNSPITLRLSQPVDTSTVRAGIGVFAGDSLVSTTFALSNDGQSLIVTLAPNIPSLPFGSLITVVGTPQLKDLNGDALQQFQSSFTTIAFQAQASSAVQSVLPGPGAADVPTNTSVTLFIGPNPVDETTLAGGLHIVENGAAVTGTITMADPNTIVFTPSIPWQNGANVQIFADTSIRDVSGNPLSMSFSSQFNTVPLASKIGPSLIRTNFNPDSSFPANGVIELDFDEPLNPATVSSKTILFQSLATGAIVPAIYSVAGAGQNIVQVRPSSPLTVGVSYSLMPVSAQSNVQNLDGLTSTWPYIGNLYAVTAGEVTPSVSAISPPSNYGSAPVNSKIVVKFTGHIDLVSVDSSTIQLNAGNTSIPVSFQFNLDDPSQVVVIPQQALPANTGFTVLVNGVRDLIGETIPSFTSRFNTGSAPDFMPPQLAKTIPDLSAGPDSVPSNIKAISFQFNKPISPASVSSAIFAIQQNALPIVPGLLSQSQDLKTVTFTFGSQLAVNDSLNVIIWQVEDIAGNASSGCCLGQFSASVTPADTSSLTVESTNPPANATNVALNANVQLTFSAPVNADTLSGIQLSQGSAPVSFTPVLSNSNLTVSLQTSTLLNPNQPYDISVSGVSDVAGNALGQPFSTSFTTGSTELLMPPTAQLLLPANTSAADPNTAVQIRFSAPMNAASLETLTIFNYTTGKSVQATFSSSKDGMTGTWQPTAALTAGQYVTQVTADDQAGNSEFFSFSFTVQ